jgi:replication-associated recombination protein RarA
MQSFIVLASDEKKTTEYLDTLIQKERISVFDIKRITQVEEATKKKAAKKSLGIETVKAIQEDVYFMPTHGEKKLLVIHDAQLLTTEAQNALLKLLEEPPTHLILILVTDNLNSLLSTIHSRCFLINLTEKQSISTLSDDEKEVVEHLSLKAIFELAEKKGKTKEETIEWSKKLIKQLEQELHTTQDVSTIQQYSNVLKKLTKIHQTVSSSNISPRMTIESVLLNIE